jgi:hypothetical protein
VKNSKKKKKSHLLKPPVGEALALNPTVAKRMRRNRRGEDLVVMALSLVLFL